MTELKQLALTKELLLAQEQTLRQQAQAASSLKDEFLAMMSHELKHPLNLIHVHTDLITRSPEAHRIPPAAVRAAQAIQRAADSQSRIIDDMLDLSQVRTGKLAFSSREVAVNQLVSSLVRAASASADESGIALHFDCAEEALLVDGDPQRLEQVAWNLLRNAIQFTPPGGRVTLKLDRQPESAMVRLVVEDTGHGIDAELLPEVFEIFSPEAATRRIGERSLGLGLALVKELVMAHGGLVAADSEGPGLGSVFTVLLPAAEPRAAVAVPSSSGSSRQSLNGARILLVTDPERPEDDALDEFARGLRYEDAIVNLAEGGEAALKLLAVGSYEILVVDLARDAGAGQAFIREARRLKLRPLPFALALCDPGPHPTAAQDLLAGFDGHLERPAAIEFLRQLLIERG